MLFLYILIRKTQKKGVTLFSSVHRLVVENKRRSKRDTKKEKKKKEKKKLMTHKQKGKEAKQLFEGEILSDISSFTHTHTHTHIHHHVVTTARERGESGLTVHAREIVPVIFE